MFPILFEIGEIKIYSFGTLIVLAFLVSSWFVKRRASNQLELDAERVFNICFALLFIGLAGARLLYVLVEYDKHAAEPLSFLYVWRGGLVFYGGLLTGLLWLAWYLPRHADLKGWSLMDIFALGGCLAIFIGRWASFLSGENYGKEAPDLAWSVTFPAKEGTQAPPNMALHPTQLYHSLHGLVLFGLLLWFLKRKPEPGRAFGLFLIAYAIGRVVIEMFRGDDQERGMLIDGDYFLSTSQLISIPILFVGVAIYLIRRPAEQ